MIPSAFPWCPYATIFLGLLFLGGCAASPEEEKASSEKYVQCLHSAALQLDDGVSDVTGVALAVESMCAPEFNESVKTYGKGLPYDGYLRLKNRLEQERLPQAAAAVMQVRATRSHNTAAKPPTDQASPKSIIVDGVARDPRAVFVEAYQAYERSDYPTALRLGHLLADQGNMDGQDFLGMIYLDGKAVAKDEVEAANWLRKAAIQGKATAQAFLGLLYFNGRGVPQDYTEAARWWRKAADQGNVEAQRNLTDLYKLRPDLRGQQTDDSQATRSASKPSPKLGGPQFIVGRWCLEQGGKTVFVQYTLVKGNRYSVINNEGKKWEEDIYFEDSGKMRHKTWIDNNPVFAWDADIVDDNTIKRDFTVGSAVIHQVSVRCQ